MAREGAALEERTMSGEADRTLRILPDPDAVARAGVELVVRRAERAVADRGAFRIVLAGGSTPRAMYRRLAQGAAAFWRDAHVFFGDERPVGPDHPTATSGWQRRRFSIPWPLPRGGSTGSKASFRPRRPPNATPPPSGSTSAQRRFGSTCAPGDGERRAHRVAVSRCAGSRGSGRGAVGRVASEPPAHPQPVGDQPGPGGPVACDREAKAERLKEVLTPGSPAPVAGVRPEGDLIWLVDVAAASRLQSHKEFPC